MTITMLAVALLTLVGTEGHAQPPQLLDPGPGQVFLSPQIDLGLQPVSMLVPERYTLSGIADRELMLPPGFMVNVFAAGGLLEGPRFMSWDPKGVLHVANMKAGGGKELTPPVNS